MSFYAVNMADSKQLVTVEWKGYCAALLSGVWQVFKDQLYADVFLTCHQQGLKVHKLMLAVFFPGLKDCILTDTGMVDNGASIKELCLDHLSKDKRGDVIKYLAEFAYSGKVALPVNRLANVLEAAEIVGFQGLAQSIREQCSKRLPADAKSESGTSGDQPVDEDVPAEKASAVGSTRPKRSNRKGIPMKLIKKDLETAVDKASPRNKDPPEETAVGTRLEADGDDAGSAVSSDGDSDRGGGESMSSAASSEEEMMCSSSSGEEEEEEEEEEEGAESDPRDGDWCETNEKARSKTIRKRVPKSSARMQKREMLKCTRCDYMTTSQKWFDRHCACHDRDEAKRNERYKCTVCPKVFQSSKSCEDHMVFHNPDLQVKCKYCPFITNKKWILRQHLAIKHLVDEEGNPVEMQLPCPQCDMTCVTNRQLRKHIRDKHRNVTKCDYCDYVNARRNRIREHMAVRHGVDDKGNSIEKGLKCEQCDYLCLTKKQMNVHVARKHKPPPDKQHMCDECGYTTVYRSNLRYHIDQVHRGVRRFMCDICGRQIAKKNNFLRHKRSHLGLKPFACTLCGQAFADRHNLRKHNARHANGGDVPKRSVVTSSGSSKSAAGAMTTMASGSASSAALKPSAEVHEGVDPAARKGAMDHAFPYCMPPASVDRLAYLGGMVDGYVGLRAAVERFDGLGSCGKIFQEL